MYAPTANGAMGACPARTNPKMSTTRPKVASRSEERRVGKECRSRCDWSSDVCSSDLPVGGGDVRPDGERRHGRLPGPHQPEDEHDQAEGGQQIGRASCRERV